MNVVKKFFIPYRLKPSKQDDNNAEDKCEDDDGAANEIRFVDNDAEDKCEDDDEGNDESRFVIKLQNSFMCFATKKLNIFNIVNYLAPGFSYATYLKSSCRRDTFPMSI